MARHGGTPTGRDDSRCDNLSKSLDGRMRATLILIGTLFVCEGSAFIFAARSARPCACVPDPVKTSRGHHFQLEASRQAGTATNHKSSSPWVWWERAWSTLLLFTSLPVGAAIPSAENCKSVSTPAYTIISCDYKGLQPSGRPYQCGSLSNCYSTSSINTPAKYAPPWTFEFSTSDASAALLSLVNAIEKLDSGLGVKVVEVDSSRLYVHAEAPSQLPRDSVDDLEFVLSPENQLVLYRGASRKSLLIYPLQRPVGDGGLLQKRLDAIQKAVGWDSAGY